MTKEEAIYRLKNMAWLYGSAEREQNIEAIDMAIEALSADAVHIETYRELYEKYVELKHASADDVQGYTEWLEKIIVDNEGANEWLCEDTPDLEWCENNCHYSSIKAECLRHLYEVSKGGDDE